MKKLLIATAALAMVAGTAQAQSSVTVYGILDINMASVDTTGSGASTAQTDNVLATSRLGFRGTEDLGGGLKAEFQLESLLVPSNGLAGAGSGTGNNASSELFNRESWVGLNSTKMGAIRIGTTDVTDAVNIDAKVSHAGDLALASELGTDKNKSVRYTTPSFSGLSAQVGYSNETATTAAAGEGTAGMITAAYVAYEAGKLGLYAGMEERKVSQAYDQKHTIFGVKYDFGVASVGLAYGTKDQAAQADVATKGDIKQTRLSVAAPVAALGSGVKVHGVYAKDETATAQTADYDKYTLALTKAFSKRTTGYVAFADTNYETSATKDTKAYTLGIVHAF
jgi:predicted porin